MKPTPKTLAHWHSTPDKPCLHGKHTVSPIALANASGAATQRNNTIPIRVAATDQPVASKHSEDGREVDGGSSVSSIHTHTAWLVRTGLMPLVDDMIRLSSKYDFPWAQSWGYHLEDPDWLSRAMAQTFMLLRPEDKEAVRELYDDWLWYQKHLDMQNMVHPEFNALCYLLDRKGSRVCNDQGEVTVLRGLKGQTRQEALQTLDTRCYEFKQWW